MEPPVFDHIIPQDNVEKLILWRKRLGFKTYEMARELGVTPNYLVSIENYHRPLSRKLKKRINQYLKMKRTEANLW